MSECDFYLSTAEIEAVKPGDLVTVRYGSSMRGFVRHDDGTGDLFYFTDSSGKGVYQSWSRQTSTPWAPMMRAQRGTLRILGHGLPREGTSKDVIAPLCRGSEDAAERLRSRFPETENR